MRPHAVTSSVLALILLVQGTTARAQSARPATVRLERARIEGLGRTREATIRELFPRPPPGVFTDAELREVERRINNLGIFDDVEVRVDGEEIVITVREKFTLSPSLDFSTGETLDDTEGAVGATEYNVLGRASQLGLQVGREQRGLTAWVWYEEHAFHPRRWALIAAAGYERAGLRFDSRAEGSSWFRDRAGGEIGWRTPYGYGLPLRYEVTAFYLRELVERDEAVAAPPDGHTFGTSMTFTWDRYTWRDLVPDGWRLKLLARPGWFVPEASRTDADCGTSCRPSARLTASATALGAIPLGELTVLTARAQADVVSSGNANHSALVGSQDGVRGLRDAFYRDRAQAYANIELRHAVKLAKRWAIQGVLFVDGAVFEPMDPRGRATEWQAAISTGAGLRVIPTILTQVVGRLDVARLHTPDQRWFFQIGATQYF